MRTLEVLRDGDSIAIPILEHTHMPRVTDAILDCVLYLYPSRQAADAHSNDGATAFLVSMPYSNRLGFHLYAVTARHVVRRLVSEIWTRLTLKNGQTFTVQITEGWIEHPNQDDVAVVQLRPLNWNEFTLKTVGYSWFITPEIITQYGIGIGDDCMWPGRFTVLPIGSPNVPTLRTGHIASMVRPVRQGGSGFNLDSFLVEAFSMSGYSGSPVFVHIPELTRRPISRGEYYHGPWLLGVDWGHMTTSVPLIRPNGRESSIRMQTNTGMMMVSPAWKIRDILEGETMRGYRERIEAEAAEHQEGVAEIDSGEIVE